jgi:hypothetical protein
MAVTDVDVAASFADVRDAFDTLDPVNSYDDRLHAGAIVAAVRRVIFRDEPGRDVLILTVYEDAAFRVMRAACGMSAESIAAYARAHRFIVGLDLTWMP